MGKRINRSTLFASGNSGRKWAGFLRDDPHFVGNRHHENLYDGDRLGPITDGGKPIGALFG